jgi:hypothetical protein
MIQIAVTNRDFMSTRPNLVDAFRQGLSESGYVEGRNVGLCWFWLAQYDPTPGVYTKVFPYQQTWQGTVVDAPMGLALERGAKFRHRCFRSPQKKPKSTVMLLAGLMGADYAFYCERTRVVLPFRSVARTYLDETALRYWCNANSPPLS